MPMRRNSQRLLLLALILIVAGFGLYYLIDKATPDENGGTVATTTPDVGEDEEQAQPQIVARDLDIPWEVAFLEENGFFVTERPGNLVRFDPQIKRHPIEGVNQVGEGGLLGMALHPDFQNNGFIYLYLTAESGIRTINRVERYRFDLADNGLSDRKVIISDIPGSRNHDGGRMAFGPDGFLYITTGDAGNEDLAQDRNSLAGKILRLKDDGSVPADNPFGNAVWTYGHRNAQGLAWDGEGRLWATEHGRSGAASGLDELNLIEKGKNYGWPIIQGDETREGMVTPAINSGARTTWAPAGLAYLGGRLFFGGLRGEALYSVAVSGEGRIDDFRTHYAGRFGRIRSVVAFDGDLYISTSNRDGRGAEKEGDDKIIRLPLTELFD